ncbi:MAG: hypothetical protein HQ564_00480 [Candidatus Saganbacteria bacterium]|nr:hypothetical protein [Candidatus Saganbacteria bacterium]
MTSIGNGTGPIKTVQTGSKHLVGRRVLAVPANFGSSAVPNAAEPVLSPAFERMLKDPRFQFYAEQLLGADANIYEPHIFVAPPEMPDTFGMSLSTEETEHNLSGLREVLLTMMAEKYKLDQTGEESPLLKPSTYPASNLLTKLANTLPDLFHLRAVVINSNHLVFSFKNMLDCQKMDSIIQNNFKGIILEKREGILRGGGKIVQYFYKGNEFLSITSYTVKFPYTGLAADSSERFSLGLDFIVELVSKMHNTRPFIAGKIICYHEFTSLIRAISTGEPSREVLSGLFDNIVSDFDADLMGKGQSVLVRTKRSKVKGKPEYRLKSEHLPSHVSYVLFVPHEERVVVGLDCPINFAEISERLQDGSLLADTSHYLERITIEGKRVTGKKVKAQFKNQSWRGVVRKINTTRSVFVDLTGKEILSGSYKTLSLSLSEARIEGGLARALADTIFDEMLFYTNSVPDEKLQCSLTEEEQSLIGAVDTLLSFYNLFARPEVEKESYAKKLPYLSDMEWVLKQLKESYAVSEFGRLLYVLRKIVKYSQEIVPILARDNQEAMQRYEGMVALIKKLEQLERES